VKKVVTVLCLSMLSVMLLSIDLQTSIETAKQNNKELRMAEEDIYKADNTYKEVRGYLLPQVNLLGGYSLSRIKLPDSALPGAMDFSQGLDSLATANDEYLAGALSGMVNSMIPSSVQKEGSLAMQLKLEQILFSGGKLINGIRAVNRYRSIQKQRYDLVERELVVSTTQLFYQCLLLQRLHQVQSEALDIAQRHLSRVELFYEEGQVSEFDLLRARLEVAKLQPQVLQAKNNYDLILAAFRKQIGTDDETIIPQGQFDKPAELEISLEDALSEGLSKRIELNLADINTEIMLIRYNAEKDNYLPNIALTADYSLFTKADSYAIESADFGNSMSVGIGFQVPIFSGFSNTSKKAYAKHDYAQARLQEANYRDLIELQIKQDYKQYTYTLQNYDVQAQNIKLAERGLQLAQVRYDNQVGIQLEVFDAQIMLNAVKLQYYQAVYELIAADRNLKKSIGYTL